MNNIQKKTEKPFSVDDKDRKILALLSKDASLSYVDLGKKVHLSSASVHERVKKLKKEGIILGIKAQLNNEKLGKELLAFIHIDTTSWAVTRSILALKEIPEIEEIHTVAGDSAMILKVRVKNTRSLEELLEIIHSIEGFKGTKSYIVLTPHLER